MATQKKSPLAQVREQFKNKESLVDRVMDVVERGSEDAEALKTRLLAVSNKKLLRILETASLIKSQFGGSRERIAHAIAEAAGKAKDKDYVARLAKYAPSRLVSLYLGATAKKAAPASKQ